MRYASTQELFWAGFSGAAASTLDPHSKKGPGKLGPFSTQPRDQARVYPRTVSGLILRVRTAADRHSVRKFARSSSENCQRKQATDETARLKMRSRWKQSWTLRGLSKPMNSAPFLRCVIINLCIPDARLNGRFRMAAIYLPHRNTPRWRDKMSQVSHMLPGNCRYPGTIEKAGGMRRRPCSLTVDGRLIPPLRLYAVATRHPSCESRQPDCRYSPAPASGFRRCARRAAANASPRSGYPTT